MQLNESQNHIYSFDENFLNNIRYIHEVRIFNEIQNNKKILIFDFRTKDEYFKSKLGLSINIPYDEHSYDFYENFNDKKVACLIDQYTGCSEVKLRLKSFKRYFIVLLMSENKIKRKTIETCSSSLNCNPDSDEKEKIIKTLLFYKALVSNGVREIGIFNLGINKLISEYSFMMNFNDSRTCIKDISAFPTDILDHRIFVGNQRDATSEDVINLLKITHIINVTQHVNNKFEHKGIKYLNILIDDTPDYQISKHFKTAYEFIEEALSIISNFTEEESTNLCSASSQIEESIAENVETLLSEFIDDLIDVEVCLDKNFPKLQQFGIISLENWRDAFNSTKDLNLRNKIIQLVYKHFFRKSNTKNRILIHCSMGVSRSPTVAIMYIMKKFQLSFEDAHSLILLHREKSDPIDSFLDELRHFAKLDFNFLNE